MGYIPPPQLATPPRPSYAQAYAKILSHFRATPLSSASSVIILVAPDVDALCAARMLGNLLTQDDVIHRIIPVPGFDELEDIKQEALNNTELHTIIMFNLGGLLDLATQSWFGDAHPNLTVHVIDSSRPLHLGNLFLAEQVTVWDDGEAEHLQELRKSFEVITFEPNYQSDDDDSEDEEYPEEDEGDDYSERDVTSGKRRSLGDGDSKPVKRRRTSRDRVPKMTREEYIQHQERVNKYFLSGTSYGQSASGTIYILATVLERVDNDLLWFAILGLTHQYTTSRISRESYDTYQTIYHDEVSRLNPPPPNGALASLNPDDTSVRASDELRFMLFRHWNLYDAMFHSSYVASKLGIWKERGRKRLTGLLAKMGFSILQTQQPYSHMDLDLKKDLLQKLNDVAPEYGLVELSYPSFARCNGYRSHPLSAADAVEGISALMDVASGVKMEVEIEGARNGGEWFGGDRIWECNAGREVVRRRDEERQRAVQENREDVDRAGREDTEDVVSTREAQWWIKNFWIAFDALNE
ncbi:hypothetical protein H0H81_001543 [Sphagnurus paluster]|uniref:CDC45-like protein n=1 Tax=Sphagnurus paluster TaxID=117069 RepID=A0A9P7K5V9_9AGAR|nr:hypothetical protein H0H81_001543 [Sphagnurus paluster]